MAYKATVKTIERPYPGGRIVDRVEVQGQVQPWPSHTVRYISRRWRGPALIRAEGVDFNLRYAAAHVHEGRGCYPLHTHPCCEFLLTLEGRGEILMEPSGPVQSCRPGTLVVAPPLQAHHSRWSVAAGRWRVLVVDFDLAVDIGLLPLGADEQVDMAFAPFYEWFFARREPSVQLPPRFTRSVVALARGVVDSLAPGTYGVCTEVVAGVLRLIALFSRSLREAGLADGRHLAPPSFSRAAALLKARTLMEHRGEFERGCVARVARTVGMSTAHFARSFRAAYGVTPKHFSQQVLMRRACGLLTDTDLPVRTVADRLGYQDPATFSRAFRQWVGVSPCHYRQGDLRRGGR